MLTLTATEELGLDERETAAALERRRGLRIREARPVKIFDSAAARYFGGRTEDISATGLRVELPSFAPVEPGDTLSVHVGLNDRGQGLANRRQMIPARVVWVDRSYRINGGIEAGIEFMANIAAHMDAA
jgi:hypothetical protein